MRLGTFCCVDTLQRKFDAGVLLSNRRGLGAIQYSSSRSLDLSRSKACANQSKKYLVKRYEAQKAKFRFERNGQSYSPGANRAVVFKNNATHIATSSPTLLTSRRARAELRVRPDSPAVFNRFVNWREAQIAKQEIA